MEKMLIHIGYPKTASTWLQEHIFNSKDLGFSNPWKAENLGVLNTNTGVMRIITQPSDFEFDAALAYEKILSEIDQTKLSTNDLLCFSNEGICLDRNLNSTANRIYQIFPNCKILCIIREQKSAILSMYNQHVKMCDTTTLESSLKKAVHRKKDKIIDVYCYLYDKLVRTYQKTFGKENVLVLPFELFVNNKICFIENICKFCELNPDLEKIKEVSNKKTLNTKLKEGTLPIKRLINKIIIDDNRRLFEQPIRVKIVRELGKLADLLVSEDFSLKQKKYYQQIISDYVGDMYRESNRITSELIGLDLGNLGYDV